MKKFLSFITAMVMVFCLIPPPLTVNAADSITYLKYFDSGSYSEKEITTDDAKYVKISDGNSIDMTDGKFYCVTDKNVSASIKSIKDDASASIIIADGCTLELTDVTASESPSFLEIYGSSNGTGKLILSGNSSYGLIQTNIFLHGVTCESKDSLMIYGLTVRAGKLLTDGTISSEGGYFHIWRYG